MNKVRITVLETTFNEKLAQAYGVEGLGRCPFLREGQVFHADYAKPEGFCDEAWKAIYQYAFALAHGVGKTGELFYHGDWIKRPNLAILSCNDGLRPVIFKVEGTSEPALP
ncbi:MAG: TIGR04076 family protein [Deltaproteobacteria bacterium]|nr:TIGR04076 family protein [Deltaproteobacteria bacterium]